MLETPKVVHSDAQEVASLTMIVPREDIKKVMGSGLSELTAELDAQDAEVAGPWFTHYFHRPTDIFDFEICLPVAVPVKPSGRMKPAQIGARKVARAIYRGPYEGLAAAWRELHEWIAANGHEAREEFWQCYLIGPDISPDSTRWQTELNQTLHP